MKKKLEDTIFVILGIILGTITTGYLINRNSNVVNFLEIMDLTIQLFNVFIVIYIFMRERKERDENRKINYKLYWYKTYILPNSMENVNKFFEKLDLHIENGMSKNEKMTNEYTNYTNELNECKKNITELMMIVSKITYTNVIKCFINFQDEFNGKITESSKEELKKIAKKYKNSIISELYKLWRRKNIADSSYCINCIVCCFWCYCIYL